MRRALAVVDGRMPTRWHGSFLVLGPVNMGLGDGGDGARAMRACVACSMDCAPRCDACPRLDARPTEQRSRVTGSERESCHGLVRGA